MAPPLGEREGRCLGSRTVAIFAPIIFGFPLALQGRLMQDGVDMPAFLFRLCGRRRLLSLRLFQSLHLLRAALAFSKLQLGRPLRSGEAQRVEHPVPSSPAKMTDEGFVLVP